LEREVTTLISCFIGVGLTHEKLFENYLTKDNFGNNLRCLLSEFFTSKSINIEELKKFLMNYLKLVKMQREKAEEAKKKIPSESEAPENESSEESNDWLPYKPMYDQFVARFNRYSKHEVLRGGKLLIR
jgi:hypothetical protein